MWLLTESRELLNFDNLASVRCANFQGKIEIFATLNNGSNFSVASLSSKEIAEKFIEKMFSEMKNNSNAIDSVLLKNLVEN